MPPVIFQQDCVVNLEKEEEEDKVPCPKNSVILERAVMRGRIGFLTFSCVECVGRKNISNILGKLILLIIIQVSIINVSIYESNGDAVLSQRPGVAKNGRQSSHECCHILQHVKVIACCC